MPTPRISAADGDFAPNILLPGDPRRVTRIAEAFLDDARLVTEVRGIVGSAHRLGHDRASADWRALLACAVAAAEGVEALMVATISDHVVRGDSLPSEQRETTFAAMVSVALGALAR